MSDLRIYLVIGTTFRSSKSVIRRRRELPGGVTVCIGDEYTATFDASERERAILAAGGKLSWTNERAKGGSAGTPDDG